MALYMASAAGCSTPNPRDILPAHYPGGVPIQAKDNEISAKKLARGKVKSKMPAQHAGINPKAGSVSLRP
jgi:hypothetical protein